MGGEEIEGAEPEVLGYDECRESIRVASSTPRGTRQRLPRCPWCGVSQEWSVKLVDGSRLEVLAPGEEARLAVIPDSPVAAVCCGSVVFCRELDDCGRPVFERPSDERLEEARLRNPSLLLAVQRLAMHFRRVRRLERARFN